MTPLLQIEDLHVWFELEEGAGELHAVQGVNLELAAGERLEQSGHRASDAEGAPVV